MTSEHTDPTAAHDDEAHRIHLSQAIVWMLDDWGLDGQQIIELLALPENTRTRHLQRYRMGSEPLPDDPEVNKRVEHLVGIADALRTTFPRNDQMRTLWLHSPHRRFNKRPPLQVIVEEGLEGLIAVRAELDCVFQWELTDGANAYCR